MKNLKNLLIVAVVAGLSIMSCTPKEINYPEGGGCSCNVYKEAFFYRNSNDTVGYYSVSPKIFLSKESSKKCEDKILGYKEYRDSITQEVVENAHWKITQTAVCK